MKFFKLIWNYLSAASLPEIFLRCLPQFLGRDADSTPTPRHPHLPNGMKDMESMWCKGQVNNVGNFQCIVTAQLLLLEVVKTYFVSTRKSSSVKLINSPQKNSHKSFKTAPIFTTLTHNTSLDLLNKHMCCDLQRIARTHQSTKCGVSSAAATLPELLYTCITAVAFRCGI